MIDSQAIHSFGTVFLRQPTATPDRLAFMNTPTETTNARILVVDDEPAIVDAVATALRYEGFEVEEAANGRDALSTTMTFEPDLIVLDWMLPDIDGLEVGQAPPRARLQDRDPLPHRQGRRREQGRGAPRRRRRLRHEAVQPRRDRRPRAGDPQAHRRASSPATSSATATSSSTRAATRSSAPTAGST